MKSAVFYLILFNLIVGGLLPETQAANPVLRKVLGIYDSELPKPRLIDKNEPPGLYDSHDGERNPIQENLAMVLNHLGFVVHQLDIRNQPLPDLQTMAQYALVISWFDRDITVPDPEAYIQWIDQQIQQGRLFLLLEHPGIEDDGPESTKLFKKLYRTIGIEFDDQFQGKVNRIQVFEKDSAMAEFEHRLVPPLSWPGRFRPLHPNTQTFLKTGYWLNRDSESHIITIGSNGGMIAPGYVLFREKVFPFRKKWKIHPFRFLRALLKPQFPAPDVTTSEGKRLFYSHIDGDGFRNRSEVNFKKYSSELVLDRFLRKYPQVPVGISVIVGDIDPDWWGDAELMEIAKQTFLQPNVEAATHTYTHPYQWQRWDRYSAYSPLGAFRYEREIDESIDWIETHLLPDNKKVELVYWSGDTTPPEEALLRIENLGLDNLNGGDTKKDKDFPSYTAVAPLMRPVGERWQIFTSASNENLYTKLWSANFHGFRNVIQTFENTEMPLRLTPVNVYYHFYIADKIAAIRSLQTVYDWILQQDLKMIFPSEYVRLVRGFISTELVEVERNVYEIQNRGALNNFRVDQGRVDLDRSRGIKKVYSINQSWYVDLDPTVERPRIALQN